MTMNDEVKMSPPTEEGLKVMAKVLYQAYEIRVNSQWEQIALVEVNRNEDGSLKRHCEVLLKSGKKVHCLIGKYGYYDFHSGEFFEIR